MNPNLYYELDAFYSNYRGMQTFALDSQLRGNEINSDDCQGVERVKDLLPDLSVYSSLSSIDLSALDGEKKLNPCGILPKFAFTDTFSLQEADTFSDLTIDESNIARKYD